MLRPSPPEPRKHVLLRRADQAAIACIALVALVALTGYWLTQIRMSHRLIDIDQAAPRIASFKVDINSADWPEIAQLPGIGETLANRIVEYRKEHGKFTSIEGLRRVSGIGVKRLDAIRPYLLPIDKAQFQTTTPPPRPQSQQH